VARVLGLPDNASDAQIRARAEQPLAPAAGTEPAPVSAADDELITWALATGRIVPESASRWRALLAEDPQGTAQWLQALEPVPELARPAAAAASTQGPAPQLFPGSGPLPPATDSGIPPAELGKLP
jgi:hypothetical protein